MSSPAPVVVDTHHVDIGTASFRRDTYTVRLKSHDRLRHLYMIGKTGAGKSTLFQNMALQDIMAGAGCCFVDPHGEAIDWLLARIPAERLEDVVIFDPGDTTWPMGLNLLEWHDESDKDFLVSEAIHIFYKLFDPEQTGVIGPQFEHWMRNAALTIMADPKGGSLIDIPRLFTDKEFELNRRRHVTDKVVTAFWEQQMAKTSDFHRSEMLNYFTSKFGRFITNSLMRNIIGQRTSALRLEDIINGQKILLVNISKGKIGELNAHMLGLILMIKLQIAVLKRAALPLEARLPFYLFVDEFQNVLTDAFINMLSEARKYGLAVHLTNQYVAQLTPAIRDAVIGNAATLIAFQIGSQDAAALLGEFETHAGGGRPKLSADHFQYLKKHHFYIRPLIDGVTYEPFLSQSLPPLQTTTTVTPEQVRAWSRLRYATPLAHL